MQLKKAFIRIVVCLCVLVCLGCAIFILDKEEIIDVPVEKLAGNGINDNLAAPQGTEEKKFAFTPAKVKVAPEEVPAVNATESICLYMGDGIYYQVNVPADLDIVTDYNKFIYARDSSLSVAVLTNVPADKLQGFASINDPTELGIGFIRSEIGKKGPQEAAKHIVGDKAIVVRAYNNPEAFATVLQSLQLGTYAVGEREALHIDKGHTQALTGLRAVAGYHLSIDEAEDEMLQMYAYEDGFLTVAQEFKVYEDALAYMGERAACVMGSSVADAVYKDSRVYYAEIGACTVGIRSINYNTSITLFGMGEEARYNILTYLRMKGA